MDTFLHDMSWAVGIRHELLTPIFYGFTWLGYTTFFLIALPFAYWAWDKNKITRVALIIFASALLNAFLKDLWQDPRPDAIIWIDPHMDDSYGLPSGHTQIGIIMWFWLAHEIQRRWAWIAAAIIASGIAFSRLYMGVHDVEDVLVGAILGFLTLAAYGWTFTAHFDWWRKLAFPLRFAALATAVAGVFVVWPGGVGSAAAIGGFFLAWYGGFALDARAINYQPHKIWWRRAVLSLLGVVGVIMLFDLLTAFQESAAPDNVILAFLNGAVVGLFVVVAVPMLAKAMGLAERG